MRTSAPTAKFKEALIGKRVTHAWRGHGSAIFLEFGALAKTAKRDGSRGNPCGELSLMLPWSWRIEKPRSILGGSWSDERRWPGMLRKIQGAAVIGMETFGGLPEIAVSLSNSLRVVSFMTAEGQPEWALLSRVDPKGSLCVRRGRLQVEPITMTGPSGRR